MRLAILLLCLLSVCLAAGPDDALFDAIHNGDTAAVRSLLKRGANANARDQAGATPLMHAGAFANEACMKLLLAAGADANAASNAGYTPLLWSLADPAKVRLLLRHKADPKPKAKDGNSALILARQAGFQAAVPLLLAAGAPDEDGMEPAVKPILKLPPTLLAHLRGIGTEPMHLVRGFTPLFLAAYLPNAPAAITGEMLDRGLAVDTHGKIATLVLPPLSVAANFANLPLVRLLLDRGADPNNKGARGLTPLMAAAAADPSDVAIIRALLEKGAEPNAQDEQGRTALDWALLQGDTVVAQALRQAGARANAAPAPPPVPVATPRSARDAVEKALALLLPSGPRFFRQSGCISCHNNSIPSLAATRAKAAGIAVDAELAAHPSKAALAAWGPRTETLAIGASTVGGLTANVSYGLLAMAEERAPRNRVTDAAALGLARVQAPDGSWTIPDSRPPLGGSIIKWTALSARSLQAYMPNGLRSQTEDHLRGARTYLLNAQPHDTQDQAFQLTGLHWTGAPREAIAKGRARLLGLQREDGGWSQLPTMPSDAFATGEALYALHTAGMPAKDPAYQRGVAYLLRTQLEDGSWFVRSRGLAFQPFRDSGLPHGRDQFLSAAATGWAAIALSAAVGH